MPRTSYSGLRTNRGFLHADPASFEFELTPVPKPADFLMTTTFSRVIFIPVGDRSPVIRCFELRSGPTLGRRPGPPLHPCFLSSDWLRSAKILQPTPTITRVASALTTHVPAPKKRPLKNVSL